MDSFIILDSQLITSSESENQYREPNSTEVYPPTCSPGDVWDDVFIKPLAVDTTQLWPNTETFSSRYDARMITPSTDSLQANTPDESFSVDQVLHKKTRGRNRQSSSSSKRKPHNQIEQKYRNTVNAAIRDLQCAIPPVSRSANSNRPTVTKAAILNRATAYIKQLEQEREKLVEENRAFREAMMRKQSQFGASAY